MEPLLLVLVGSLALMIPTAYAAKIGAPFVPARQKGLDKLFEDINLGPGDVFVDLGAGNGRTLFAAAQRGARAIGYELSPIMWAITWLRLLFTSKDRYKHKPKIHFGNFYKQELPPKTTFVYAFLLPATMPRAYACIQQQQNRLPHLKALLSYIFQVKDVQPDATIRTKESGTTYVYNMQ